MYGTVFSCCPDTTCGSIFKLPGGGSAQSCRRPGPALPGSVTPAHRLSSHLCGRLLCVKLLDPCFSALEDFSGAL